MKINPVSFSKAQRPCLFWQELRLPFPDSRCPSEVRGGAGGWEGGEPSLLLQTVAAGTRALDNHPCHVERSDLENAIMYI